MTSVECLLIPLIMKSLKNTLISEYNRIALQFIARTRRVGNELVNASVKEEKGYKEELIYRKEKKKKKIILKNVC